MPIVPLFDARIWIAGNLVGGTEVNPDTFGAYSNFLMMWHIFEMLVCGGAADSRSLVQASRRLTRSTAEAVDLAKLDMFIRHFSGLLSPADAAALCGDPVDAALLNSVQDVSRVLRGARESIRHQALTLMLLVRRVHSKTMRDRKSVVTLNDSMVDLDIGAHSLSVLVALSRSRPYVRNR